MRRGWLTPPEGKQQRHREERGKKRAGVGGEVPREIGTGVGVGDLCALYGTYHFSDMQCVIMGGVHLQGVLSHSLESRLNAFIADARSL